MKEKKITQTDAAALEKYTELYDFAPVGYFTLDRKGTIRSVNLTGASLLGIERSQLIGKGFRFSIAAEARPAFAGFLEKVFMSSIKEAGELELLAEGDLPRFVRIEAVADASGEECCIALIDITELNESAKKLRDSEVRYRRLFESAKDGILILDAETGKVVDANPFLLQLLGYSYDALYGQYIWELGVFKDFAASREVFMALQDNEYIRYDDLPLETLDGRHIAVELVSNIYLVEQSKVIQCNIPWISSRPMKLQRPGLASSASLSRRETFW